MSDYFHISFSKEILDSLKLIEMIREEGWINPSTIIVNCSPDYSSRVVQLINHKLSHFNRNELYECIPLEMPYPNMSQIYDAFNHKYEMFDRYLVEWVRQHIMKDTNYLFVGSCTLRGKNFNKVKSVIKSKLEPSNYRFASIYLETASIFRPDYYVEEFDKQSQGGILFEWENSNNPNWGY